MLHEWFTQNPPPRGEDGCYDKAFPEWFTAFMEVAKQEIAATQKPWVENDGEWQACGIEMMPQFFTIAGWQGTYMGRRFRAPTVVEVLDKIRGVVSPTFHFLGG
jgi:hypothetical protein